MKAYEHRALTFDLGFCIDAAGNPDMPIDMVELYRKRIEQDEARLGVPEMVARAVSQTAEIVPLPLAKSGEMAVAAA